MRYFLIYLFLCPLLCIAQKEDRVWVFDDSIAIDFNNISTPLVYSIDENIESSENHASISDKNGNLLFFIGKTSSINGSYSLLSAIYNSSGTIIQNGDSIESHISMSQGCLFIPSLGDSDIIYLFYIDLTTLNFDINPPGFYYARLEKSSGSCISKSNILLLDTLTEKMTAVKHGNGRDWWIIIHKDNSKIFYKFLLTPFGINGPFSQTTGPKLQYGSQGQMKFSPDGSKLGFVTFDHKTGIFDFDRCTGLLSNYLNLGNYNAYGCSFSPSGNMFYTSTIDASSCAFDSLFQYDLTSANILQSKNLIWADNQDSFLIGQHLLAPDGRIYIASQYCLGTTVYDTANMYLTVITKPDFYGSGCNIEPYSFYLNGLRSTIGLPNMVNYNLDTLHGSACDTLVGVGVGIDEVIEKGILNIYPNPASDELTIDVLNGIALKKIEITNELGVTVMKLKQTKPNQQVNIKSLSAGVYFIKLQMQNGEIKMNKFIKQ